VTLIEKGGYRYWYSDRCWRGYCFVCEMETHQH